MSKIYWLSVWVILSGLSTPGFSGRVATAEEARKYGITLSSGGNFNCALFEVENDISLKVKCWGGVPFSWKNNPPPLTNPRMISSGSDHVCVLDDAGVQCWGENDNNQLDVPHLVNPRMVASGGGRSCAIDDLGVTCWGDPQSKDWKIEKGNPWKIPYLKNPKMISVGPYHACVLDENGIQCWGDLPKSDVSKPILINPKAVSVGQYHTCAIDDTGLKCWGDNGSMQSRVPKLDHPSNFSTSYLNSCAIDESSKVTCWGNGLQGQNRPSKLINPKIVSSGSFFNCAVDDMGVQCWGQVDETPNELKNFTSSFINFYLNNLGPAFSKLSKYVYMDKKAVFEILESTISAYTFEGDYQASNPVIHINALSNLYVLYQSKVLLEETHSQYVSEKVLPRLDDTLTEWSKKLGINSVSSIDLTNGVVDISFSLVESSLQASKPYLNGVQQKEIESILLDVATAKAISGQNFENYEASAKDLLSALAGHHELFAALVESERTVGFGKLLLSVEGYLRGK